jgi:cell division protein FtsL
MAKSSLNRNQDFLVSDDKVLVYIMAFLFTCIFIYGLIDAINKKFSNIDYLNFVFILALLPAILLVKAGKSKRIYIRVNKTGIFQNEQLVTGWHNLIRAYISQKEKTFSIQDNFILVLDYKKEGKKGGFRRKIPLTNTQNKSEEEVLAAVMFFWKENRRVTEG